MSKYIDKQILSVGIEGVRAEVYIYYTADGGTRLRGRAITTRNAMPIVACHWHQLTLHAQTAETIAVGTQYVCGKVAAEYKRNQKAQIAMPATGKAETGIFSDAYADVGDVSVLMDPVWARSTARSTQTYFERQILPRLDAIGPELCAEDMTDIQADLVAHALRNLRSNRNPDQAASGVADRLYRINYVYEQLQHLTPWLPAFKFSVSRPDSVWIPEQAKSIPEAVRVQLAVLINRLSAVQSLALGVAMMWLCGLRTAEAAAVRMGNLILTDRYVVYPVLTQYYNGTPCPTLKSEAARRVVIGPYFLRSLILQRIEMLKREGYTRDQINEMPLATIPGRPYAYVSPNLLSAFGRELLMRAGYTPEMLQAVGALLRQEPDYDDNMRPTLDITAYILRRDWCTRACNICGMNSGDVDYLLGHAYHAARVKDYRSPDIQADLATQLERYVFLPDISANPAFCANPLSARTVDFSGDAVQTLGNDSASPMWVTLDLHTREPGDTIMIESPAPARSVKLHRSAADTPDLRAARRLLVAPYDARHYGALIAKGMGIAIRDLLNYPGRKGEAEHEADDGSVER